MIGSAEGRNRRAREAVWVALVCALLGAIIGYRNTLWQVALEPAQVLAGLVQYPPDNPFYLYQVKTWTVWHQLLMLGLKAGASERLLSALVSTLAGAVSFSALGLFILAAGARPWLAMAAPAFVYLTRIAYTGPTYPIMLLGETHTYGMLSLVFTLLALALLGLGFYRPAALLIGVAPAIHPSVGLWLNLIVGMAVVASPRHTRARVVAAWPYLLAGYLLSGFSLAHFLWMGRTIPAAAGPADRDYLSAFVEHWDLHRRRFPLVSAPVLMALLSCALAALCLVRPAGTTPSLRVLARALLASALFGALLSSVHWLPPSRVPPVLLALMPARYLLLSTATSVLLLIGTLGRMERRLPARVYLLGLVSTPFLIKAAPAVLRAPGIGVWVQVAAVTAGALLLISGGRRQRTLIGGALVLLALSVPTLGPAPLLLAALLPAALLWLLPRFKRDSLLPFRVATLGALALLTLFALTRRTPPLSDWRTDPALAAAHGERMLATAGDLHLMQVRSGAPVLIDGGGLDGLPYAPGGGAAVARILQDVYGLDLFDPPAERRASPGGGIPPAATRPLWEGRSEQDWVRLREQYGVTGVLTYPDWKLRLPLAATSDEFALYRVPERP